MIDIVFIRLICGTIYCDELIPADSIKIGLYNLINRQFSNKQTIQHIIEDSDVFYVPFKLNEICKVTASTASSDIRQVDEKKYGISFDQALFYILESKT